MVLTNSEKYLKDGVDVEELYNDLKLYNEKIKSVTNYYTRDLSLKFLKEFLKQPVKPTLTEDEKVILRNIEFKDYNYIGRNTSGDLYVHYGKNDSFNGTWFIMFKKSLFKFIQPRRRI